ncbi:signal transduction histidine kinase [Janthinobacterium sp. CG_23.3]|uniref:ATP-binding protein n=1 Tax=unclassified Janthinobacterium TaxID=2610881 RepID=UPI0003466AFF|nr:MULTISPECIES: ATP-binding protein [unclassified Janthinobacterium]MEC5162637.1 signal transduction histidine kinase [Janthinobacterium sp. CG_S6]
MPEASRYARALAWLLPQSLLGRLSVVMVAGVLLTQLVGNLIWGAQLRKDAEVEARIASQHIAHSAAGTVRFFLSLPVNYRPILIQQFREMGGTRFFVNVNRAPLAIAAIEPLALAGTVVDNVGATLKADLPQLAHYQVALAWPEQLTVSDSGSKIADLPASWVQHILLAQPNPAPILVIQAELEPGNWLYLAALMPNPYFLDSGNPLSRDRVLLQGLSLAAVLLLSILVVRWTTRPLAALSDAAEAFGKGENTPDLPETGSREFVKTARAFSAMRERIQRYLEDRERLFVSISHDLRTPITRLKLRTELLDDDDLRNEFHDDLDELDMMVKGALQCVKDSDIHENATEVRLDALLQRIVRGTQLGGHQVRFTECGLSVTAKPLALKRAIGNLLDNALYYGKTAEISAHREAGHVAIRIRDHGPGVPEDAFGSLFQPYVRLEHGRDQNADGMGLGLGIARSIVQAHGGELTLQNHPDGGLVATISLPAQ